MEPQIILDTKYLIANTSEIDSVDFSQIKGNDKESVRRSPDGAKFVVGFDGDIPDTLSKLTTKEGPYTHQEALEIIGTPEWNLPIGIGGTPI